MDMHEFIAFQHMIDEVKCERYHRSKLNTGCNDMIAPMHHLRRIVICVNKLPCNQVHSNQENLKKKNEV